MGMNSTQFVNGALGIKDRTRPLLIRLFAALARAGSAIRAESRARRAYAELARLDDRMLRDIGVSRSEIHSLVRRPGPQALGLGWWRSNHRRDRS